MATLDRTCTLYVQQANHLFNSQIEAGLAKIHVVKDEEVAVARDGFELVERLDDVGALFGLQFLYQGRNHILILSGGTLFSLDEVW